MAATALVLAMVLVVSAATWLRRGCRWGSTGDERAAAMAGDEWLGGHPARRVVMTRAVSMSVPPERVWPWLAQLGRGAGWYSHDRLDNGGRASARHVVSWIPEPRLGDAAAIGYLRHLAPGRELAWWVPGESFLGARTRMVTSICLRPRGGGSRVVIRISADAEGRTAGLLRLAFPVIDSLMACRQLVRLRQRAESNAAEQAGSATGETGRRDQYQLYQTIFADGAQAGVPGHEQAARWRAVAEQEGLVGRALDSLNPAP